MNRCATTTLLSAMCAAALFAAIPPATAQDGTPPSFIAFESGPVRPAALSGDGSRLVAVNTPANRLELFDADHNGALTDAGSAPVDMAVNPVSGKLYVSNTEANDRLFITHSG